MKLKILKQKNRNKIQKFVKCKNIKGGDQAVEAFSWSKVLTTNIQPIKF